MPRCLIDCRAEPDGLPVPLADALQTVCDAALADEDLDQCSMSVLVIDAEQSDHLHREHFDIAGATDVMTFPDGSPDPESGTIHLGDIAICPAIAAEVVGRRSGVADTDLAIRQELVLYALHGLLHLLGYDDHDADDLAEMWQRQRDLLALVDIPLEAEPTA